MNYVSFIISLETVRFEIAEHDAVGLKGGFYSGLDSKVVAECNSPVDVRIGHYRHLWPLASTAVYSHVYRFGEMSSYSAAV